MFIRGEPVEAMSRESGVVCYQARRDPIALLTAALMVLVPLGAAAGLRWAIHGVDFEEFAAEPRLLAALLQVILIALYLTSLYGVVYCARVFAETITFTDDAIILKGLRSYKRIPLAKVTYIRNEKPVFTIWSDTDITISCAFTPTFKNKLEEARQRFPAWNHPLCQPDEIEPQKPDDERGGMN